MLKNAKTFSSFSVNDLDKAQDFYGNTLGLDVEKEDMGILSVHTGGGNTVVVYPKDDHLPATFTVLNFSVDDVRKTVADLKSKGVKFEHYNNPYYGTDPDGISSNGHSSMAWFKDPAGNVFSVMEEKP